MTTARTYSLGMTRYETALSTKRPLDHDQNRQPDQLKILFCSRTHSQLTQLVEELRKTEYARTIVDPEGGGGGVQPAIRVAALASRKQLCINSGVQKYQNVARMNDECLDLQKSMMCPFQYIATHT